MEERSAQALRSGSNGLVQDPILEKTPATLLAHGLYVTNGNLNLAGRDVSIYNHYHGYTRVDMSILDALHLVRNLRKVHLDVLSKATPGTGTWLFKTDIFILWLDPCGSFKILWGTGIPGAGKTVLASIVIRELEARAQAAGGQICVAYVYIRYSDGADLTVSNVLEILVKQTVERHPECLFLAEQAYARHLRENTQPTEAELLQLCINLRERRRRHSTFWMHWTKHPTNCSSTSSGS
ncbi:hypothetical protein BKA70DRAFT_176890 [Coprinopsis sp. MPI-PUGE-AT-0042]|nr:hypothetical protein BKA70DRAFT_176890 [Coprinopsis sp. MPI-PUGE-AT-0042]